MDVHFRRLWLSSASANLADGILLAGLPVLAVAATSSPLLVSLVQVALVGPIAVAALPSGALADRRDRVGLIVWANAVRAVALLTVTVVVASSSVLLVAVYAGAVVMAAGETLADAASESHVPSLVGDEGLDAAHARLVGTQTLLNYGIGAPVGAALATAGDTWIFVVATGLFAGAAIAARRIRRAPVSRAVEPTTMRADIHNGLLLVVRHATLRRLALANAYANIANSAFAAVAVLLFVDSFGYPARGFGIVLALLAAGGTVGAVGAEWVLDRVGHRRVLLAGPSAAGLGYAVIAIGLEPITAAAAIVVIGATGMLWNVANRSVRQRHTPDHLLGRVKSTMALIAVASAPLGALAGGALTELAGLQTIAAVTTTASIASLITIRRVNVNPNGPR